MVTQNRSSQMKVLKQVKIPFELYQEIEALAEAQGARYSTRTSRPETQAIIVGLLARALDSCKLDGVLIQGNELLENEKKATHPLDNHD